MAAKAQRAFNPDLADLPPALQWREWMGCVEAAIFAARNPVPREVLARLVGPGCNLDHLLADIIEELRARPYDLVFVAGGYQLRTRPRFVEAIRAVNGEAVRHAVARAGADPEMLTLAAMAGNIRVDLGEAGVGWVEKARRLSPAPRPRYDFAEGHARFTAQTGDRRGHDDAAARSLSQHPWDDVFHRQPIALEIDVEHHVPPFLGDVPGQSHVGDAGIADDLVVCPAEAPRHRRQHRQYLDAQLQGEAS